MKRIPIFLTAVLVAASPVVCGQEESAKSELRAALTAVRKAAELPSPGPFEAALRRLEFVAGPENTRTDTTAKAIQVYRDLAQLWRYQMKNRVGAFYTAENREIVQMMTSYSRFEEFIADSLVHAGGETYYPSSESRAFLAEEAYRAAAGIPVRKALPLVEQRVAAAAVPIRPPTPRVAAPVMTDSPDRPVIQPLAAADQKAAGRPAQPVAPPRSLELPAPSATSTSAGPGAVLPIVPAGRAVAAPAPQSASASSSGWMTTAPTSVPPPPVVAGRSSAELASARTPTAKSAPEGRTESSPTSTALASRNRTSDPTEKALASSGAAAVVDKERPAREPVAANSEGRSGAASRVVNDQVRTVADAGRAGSMPAGSSSVSGDGPPPQSVRRTNSLPRLTPDEVWERAGAPSENAATPARNNPASMASGERSDSPSNVPASAIAASGTGSPFSVPRINVSSRPSPSPSSELVSSPSVATSSVQSTLTARSATTAMTLTFDQALAIALGDQGTGPDTQQALAVLESNWRARSPSLRGELSLRSSQTVDLVSQVPGRFDGLDALLSVDYPLIDGGTASLQKERARLRPSTFRSRQKGRQAALAREVLESFTSLLLAQETLRLLGPKLDSAVGMRSRAKEMLDRHQISQITAAQWDDQVSAARGQFVDLQLRRIEAETRLKQLLHDESARRLEVTIDSESSGDRLLSLAGAQLDEGTSSYANALLLWQETLARRKTQVLFSAYGGVIAGPLFTQVESGRYSDALYGLRFSFSLPQLDRALTARAAEARLDLEEATRNRQSIQAQQRTTVEDLGMQLRGVQEREKLLADRVTIARQRHQSILRLVSAGVRLQGEAVETALDLARRESELLAVRVERWRIEQLAKLAGEPRPATALRITSAQLR